MDCQRQHRRFAFTLLELIIVMVILIAVAALAIPSVQRSFSAQKLLKAADLVRGELGRARVRAMRTGKIHAFFYQEQSGFFKMGPFDNEVANALSTSMHSYQQKQTGAARFDGDSLPKGIVFIGGQAVSDSRSEMARSENSSGNTPLRPILFYPDGSSQTARIYLRSNDRDVAEVRLRGMTGTSTSAMVTER